LLKWKEWRIEIAVSKHGRLKFYWVLARLAGETLGECS
jgi:hypothetical protein